MLLYLWHWFYLKEQVKINDPFDFTQGHSEGAKASRTMIEYILCLALFCIGLYCVLRKRNIIKIVIGLGIIEYAINLLFVLTSYRMNSRAPVLDKGVVITNMVDPLPHALVLTNIVIGLAVTALIVAIAIRLYEKYGTFDITKIRKLRG